jgi:hypothetical protein
MKIWLLKPIDSESGPWDPWYDKPFGFVIRAATEERARQVADREAHDLDLRYRSTLGAWLDANLVSCVELTGDGSEEVLLTDFRSA